LRGLDGHENEIGIARSIRARGETWMRSVRRAIQLADANPALHFIDYARSSDERDVVSARTQFASDPATDCACTKDCDA
jgi:hypothetical protein